MLIDDESARIDQYVKETEGIWQIWFNLGLYEFSPKWKWQS